MQGVSHREILKHVLDWVVAVNPFRVAFQNNVFLLDAGAVSRTSGHHAVVMRALAHHERAVADRKAHLFLQLLVDDDVADSEERPPDSAEMCEVLEVALRGVYGDRESDVLRAEYDGRVDADCRAVHVHERPARVARVDRRVGLDQPAHFLRWRHGVGFGRDRARESGNDPKGHRVFEKPQRVPDRDHALTELKPRGVAQRHGREIFRRDLDDSHVVHRVAAQNLCREFIAVIRDYGVFGFGVDEDVLVCKNEAVLADREPGPAAYGDHAVAVHHRVRDLEFRLYFELLIALPAWEKEIELVLHLFFQVFEVLRNNDRHHRGHDALYGRNDLLLIHPSLFHNLPLRDYEAKMINGMYVFFDASPFQRVRDPWILLYQMWRV